MKEQVPYHVSVMPREVIEYLNPQPGGIYIDATFGGGGHTRALLTHGTGYRVISFDWDTAALDQNGEPLLAEYPKRLQLVWANFTNIEQALKKGNIRAVDGIVADFGTSQHQIFERPGFSFGTDTPLDMRMSPGHQRITAAHILARSSEQELTVIFKEYGQEHRARAIARAIVEQRKQKQIRTTAQLVALVESVVGGRGKRKIHPATQVFQALRIVVNRELDNIRAFLPAALRLLKPGGRLVCISFHSLEDLLVKQFCKDATRLYGIATQTITPKPVEASAQEVHSNPSARSARLRVLEREKSDKSV
ncbi:MAG: 16S rRNA (cytosine(1402)-N(4))-methyltransferase RsmH [Candidatus Babeliales bacterium]